MCDYVKLISHIDHSNIDRILAIYQALYDKWAPESGRENESTKLYPFPKSESDFRMSKDIEIRDWTRLGFATPGDKKPLDAGQLKDLEKYINEYYAWYVLPFPRMEIGRSLTVALLGVLGVHQLHRIPS